MIYIINKYNAESNSYKLETHNCTTWLTKSGYAKLLSDSNLSKSDFAEHPVFVKIECKDELGKFLFYSRVSELPDTPTYNELGDDFIWLAKEILPDKDISTNKQGKLHVSIVNNVVDLQVAESVTVKINEKEVDNWSDVEFANAIKHLKHNVGLTSIGQKYFFCPGTKKTVVATVEKITPSPMIHDEPFLIDEHTEFEINGRPANAKQTINFNQIGGQSKAINELRRLIQLPMNFPEYFEKFDVEPPKGVILYGPPGNGKTMIARAVAESFGSSFIEIDLSDALQKYKGVGEHNLQKKFDEAERKRNSVIFIDEIDAIASIRCEDREGHEISLVGKLLSLMDGIKARHRVFVIGATNRLNAIDSALRRPHRFDKDIEVPQPDEESRLDIILKKVHLDKPNLFDPSIDMNFLRKLAKRTEGYSGADLTALYAETVMSAINKHVSINSNGKADISVNSDAVLIERSDFENALKTIKTTEMRSKNL